jgi:ABC-type lipoprotein release transport system permease subunit
VFSRIALRNIWRNPRRSILTICAIAFACLLLVFMLSFQFGSYDTLINSAVKIHAGHLQIQATGYNEKRDIRRVVTTPQRIGQVLDQMPQIDAYTYRASAFALLSSGPRTYGAMVIGVDPAREAHVSSLKSLIRHGTFITPDKIDQALLGSRLAKNLKVDVGDELTLLGQGRDGSIAATMVRVCGIYATGLDEFDRASIHLALETFQRNFSMQDTVHQVVVIARSLKAVPPLKGAIQQEIQHLDGRYPLVALDWQELVPGLKQSIEMDLVSGMIFYGILIVVVAFSILNTFLMAIFERTREFGVMMALGTTPQRLTKLLLMESMTLTVMGLASGVLLGVVVTGIFEIHGIEFPGASELLSQFGISGRIYPQLSWLSILIGPAAVLLVTFAAALYPALKIRNLKPVEAMLHV